MNEKRFKKGLTRRLFSVVLALTMVVALMPMSSTTAYAASYGGSTTLNGVIVTVTGDEWIMLDDPWKNWWICCNRTRLNLNPSATTDNFWAADIGGYYMTITNENGGTHSCSNCGATVSWGVSTHIHGSWDYTADGATLTAECKADGDCTLDDKKVSLTLSASSANYSGSAVEVTMDTSAWVAAGLTAPTIDYEAKNGSALTDGKAVNVGSYTAKITVNGVTAKKDFEITSASSNKPSSKEPEVVHVDLDTNKSEVAYGTVFMHNRDNVRNIFDMKVHSVDARTKSNQEFLAASYAKNQGKRARILLTTGIYSRNKLAAKDLGDKKFLSFINLEKKVMPVYAVCYNQTDKAYYLAGTKNANGTAVFNDFIARDATNITIFTLE